MNAYIEIIGPACIGKTTIANKLAEETNLKDYQVTNSTKKKIPIAIISPSRIRMFFRLFWYIKSTKKASVINSIIRAIYILKIPYRKSLNGMPEIVIIDQGPVGAISSVGIKGKEWSELANYLVPNEKNWKSIFLFLSISEEEHNKRREKRIEERRKAGRNNGRNSLVKLISSIRSGFGATGKESVDLQERIECYEFWEKRLVENGHSCIRIRLDDFQTCEIVDKILNGYLIKK